MDPSQLFVHGSYIPSQEVCRHVQVAMGDMPRDVEKMFKSSESCRKIGRELEKKKKRGNGGECRHDLQLWKQCHHAIIAE